MKKEEIKILWEGPFDILDITNGKINNRRYEVKNTSIGLYQIYGSHPLYGNEILVYIGRTKDRKGFKSRLNNRWEIEYGNDSENIKVYLGTIFSDSKFLTKEIEEKLIEKAEILLINTMKPAYNSSNIKSVSKLLKNDNYMIYNIGNYRNLYPILDTNYFWKEHKNVVITDYIAEQNKVKIDNLEESYGFEINKFFKIKGDYIIWFGVDYELWNSLKIPLVLEIYSENKTIVNKLNKSKYFEKYSYDDGETTDIHYCKFDDDFFNKDNRNLSISFNEIVEKTIKQVESVIK
ncbi:MAG: hypothetical protein WC141_07110 [Arcobacteraceae bacterium]